jgi:pimeloyl-ACP methyl ester carboxylesterase
MDVKVKAPYDLKDMANDRIGLLNELQLQRAHRVGASMDGMIVSVVAAQHPERVIRLASIISSLGLFAHNLPPPGERNEEVQIISAPTLVVHGKDHSLIPIAHSEYTAELIKGSKFIPVDSMATTFLQQYCPPRQIT